MYAMASPLLIDAQSIRVDSPSFTSHYDISTQCPTRVFWVLHKSDIGDAKRSPSWQFIQDVPSPMATAAHDDYRNSGYHRGHLCPAKDRSASTTQMRSTFALSNCAAQTPAVNTGSWKVTENICREYAELYDSVSVLVFPCFLDRDTLQIGAHGVCVPHAFFKAVWVTKTDSVLNAWFVFNK